MNINIIKNDILTKIGSKVRITTYGMRNHTEYFDGYIYHVYQNFFTIMYNGIEKSFNYRDIITKDIAIKYL